MVQLRRYIESFSDKENISVDERIEIGKNKLFDFNFKLDDDVFYDDFKKYFIRVNYFRDIEHDTFGRFKFELENILWLKQDYLNGLIKSLKEDVPIFENYSLLSESDYNSKSLGSSDSKGGSTSKQGQLFSDLPQTLLNDSTDYGTTKTNIDGATKTDSVANNKGQNEGKNKTKTTGKLGSQTYGEMLNSYRMSLVPVREIMMDELSELFIGIILR